MRSSGAGRGSGVGGWHGGEGTTTTYPLRPQAQVRARTWTTYAASSRAPTTYAIPGRATRAYAPRPQTPTSIPIPATYAISTPATTTYATPQ